MKAVNYFARLLLRFLRTFTYKRFYIWLFVFSLPFIVAFSGLAYIYYKYLPELPSLEQLEQISPKLVTHIYDANGNIIHKYFVERREWVPIEDFPKEVIQAVIATEDRAFYRHWGMNVLAVTSAVREHFSKGTKLRGASTLTQQLTKLLFLTPERSVGRKIKEMLTAIRIEQTYTKDEILEFYLNQVYLAGGNYGFQAAGRYYFGHGLDSLTIPEYAVLAGMLQRPESYRPDKHPKEAMERRNTVLYSMRDAGYINNDDYHKYIEMPVVVSEAKDTLELAAKVGPYFVEEVRKYMEKTHGEKSLYADGVSVYTTLDPDIQNYADSVALAQVEVLRRRVKYMFVARWNFAKRFKMNPESCVNHFDSLYTIFREEIQADPKKKDDEEYKYKEVEIAAVLIENETGAIRAMVGGSDYKKKPFNRAVQALRPPGSSFKPIMYATAMDNGSSPCDTVTDAPASIRVSGGGSWHPKNADHRYGGKMTVRQALYQSRNVPAVKVGMRYGIENIINYARKFGIEKTPFEPLPSIILGAKGATVLEMTSAYTVFPNGGTRLAPFMIDSIVDKDGDAIERHKPVETEVIRPASAYMMVDMMKDVNIRGTGKKVWASGFQHPSGGKTGTTNSAVDTWYIGYTKQYTMGVRVGFDENEAMGRGHAGGTDALPFWISVMKYVHKDLPKMPFPMPDDIVARGICVFTNMAAGPFCSPRRYCLYAKGTAPEERCDGVHNLESDTPEDEATMFSSKKAVPGVPVPPPTSKSKSKAAPSNSNVVRTLF